MDLSSLEGPPIQDSRFSGPSWGGSVPHIQLDTSVLSPSRSDGEYEYYWDRDGSELPPRPASTDLVSPLRTHRYSAIDTSSIRRSEIRPLNVGNQGPVSPLNTDAPVLPRPRSSHTSRPYREQSLLSAQQGPSAPSSSSYRRHPSRLQSQSFSSPHQLVWLESEQIWVLTTPKPTPAPTNFALQRPTLAPLATTMNSRPPSTYIPPQQTHPANLSHSRSMETFFGNTEVMSPNYDDLPPPYERHIYDQQLATGAGVSRWTAVARRVNQSPL